MGPKDSTKGLTPSAFEARVLGFIGLGIVALGFVFCLPPIPQDQKYHAFADDRTMLGMPNFLNVASNLSFLVVGVLGLRLLLRHDSATGQTARSGNDPNAGRSWSFSLASFLPDSAPPSTTSPPTTTRLVWNRLPLTVAFMGFFAGMICDRIGARAGVWLLLPFVWLGIVSVLKWHMGEQRDAGDLRCTASYSSIPW